MGVCTSQRLPSVLELVEYRIRKFDGKWSSNQVAEPLYLLLMAAYPDKQWGDTQVVDDPLPVPGLEARRLCSPSPGAAGARQTEVG